MINFSNYLKYSVIAYLLIAFFIWMQKPSLIFDKNKNIKKFGVGSNKTIFYYPLVLIVLAIVLYFSTKFKSQHFELRSITPIQSLIIGIAQCFALIPGTSRSGITISAALALGIDAKTASKFSFLLAIPTIGAIACYQLISVDLVSFINNFKSNLIGMIASFIVAYLTIDFFIKFIEKIGFMPFIIYRLLLGFSILFFII